MSKKLEDILDICLSRMADGEDIEDCLRDYPDHAEELRSLLKTASVIKSSSALMQPRSDFRALAKQRLLAEARARQTARQQRSGWLSFFEWQRRWAIAIAAVILVILIGGSTTVVASSNAMPDDFLYPVKLAVENVRLTFAGSDMDKAELEAEFADRRVQEIAQMAEEGKWEKVEATAERLSGHLVKIVQVAEKKRTQGQLDEQDIAKLRRMLAYYATDHPFIFEKSVAQMPSETKMTLNQLFAEAKLQYARAIEDVNIAVRKGSGEMVSQNIGDSQSLQGIIRLMADGKWVVGEEVINIDPNTRFVQSPKVGASVTVQARYNPDGSLTAREIVVRPVSVTPSGSGTKPDVAIPETAEPALTDSEKSIEGPPPSPVESPKESSYISASPVPSVSPDAPVVIGPSQTPDTKQEAPGLVEPEPSRFSPASPDSFEPSGTVEPSPTGPARLPVTPVITVETLPEVSDTSGIRSFTGIIWEITGSEWIVGNRTVIVENATIIQGAPAPGRLAKVWVTVAPDGSLIARGIWVQGSDVEIEKDKENRQVPSTSSKDVSSKTPVIPSALGISDDPTNASFK